MRNIYEGPIYRDVHSDTPWNNRETLRFPDGEEVLISRDRYELYSGHMSWNSDLQVGKAMYAIIEAYEHAGKPVHWKADVRRDDAESESVGCSDRYNFVLDHDDIAGSITEGRVRARYPAEIPDDYYEDPEWHPTVDESYRLKPAIDDRERSIGRTVIEASPEMTPWPNVTIQDALAATASPTVAARSEQVAEIFASR